jgi:CRISPR/Cas system type I-B associated protein Csh2 (Cas7 group RAMP superfamily)
LQRKTRSILEELESLRLNRDREQLVESRASHVIQGAINLLSFIKENYTSEQAEELKKRLLLSIRNEDSEKFEKGVKKFK